MHSLFEASINNRTPAQMWVKTSPSEGEGGARELQQAPKVHHEQSELSFKLSLPLSSHTSPTQVK